ncbi:hypothetical protein M0R45_001074 [Rubus argutus]|uniref:Uncharacterized protein n=1 Tax=Rubus argutus TaxID=59490 RepID=A0AAW1VLL5_RUBAR
MVAMTRALGVIESLSEIGSRRSSSGMVGIDWMWGEVPLGMWWRRWRGVVELCRKTKTVEAELWGKR